MIIGRTFTFCAAHELPKHKGKCKNVHGHNYKLEVEIEGNLNADTDSPEFGMVADFGNLDKTVNELIIKQLDHTHLNNHGGIGYPTVESIALWITKEIADYLPMGIHLRKVKLWENDRSYAEVRL